MWSNVIGQDKVKEKLGMLFKTNKLAHAYLFYGSEGIGKDAAAIEFAKLLNCSNPVNGNEACDKCENCLKISTFKSEYFNFVCALPAGRSDTTDSDPIEKLTTADFESYLEQLQLKSKNPYHRISLHNANNIRINSIRAIIDKIYFTTGKKNRIVFLISEADKMKQEAANALLKILEEPPKNSVLILTTSKLNSLPSTVIGRCQKIYFDPLTESQIKSMLITYVNENKTETEIQDDDIELASKLANGSVSRAIESINFGVKEIRNLTVKYLIGLLRDNGKDVISIIRFISENNNKERTRFFLYILNIWFKDLLNTKYNGKSNLLKIANYDIKDRLLNFSNNYPDTDIYGVILALEECEKYILQNVHLPLILTNLSFTLKELIKQKD